MLQCLFALPFFHSQSGLFQTTHPPSQHSISDQNPKHNAYPLALIPDAVAVEFQYAFSVDHALVRERGLVHALAARTTGVVAVAEFVDHHSAEDIRLLWVPEGDFVRFVSDYLRNSWYEMK